MKTSFDVQIAKLDNISVKYIGDDKPKIYKNIRSKFVGKYRISVPFNQ